MKSILTPTGALIGLFTLASLVGCQTTQSSVAVAPASLSAAGKPKLFAFQTDAMPAVHLGDGDGKIADIQQYPRETTPGASKSVRWNFELNELPEAGMVKIAIFSLSPNVPCLTALSLNGQNLADLAKSGPAGSGVMTNAEVAVPKGRFQVGINYLQITEHECSGGGWNDSLVESASLKLSWGKG